MKLTFKIAIFGWAMCSSWVAFAHQSQVEENLDPRCHRLVNAEKFYYGTEYPQNYREATKYLKESALDNCGKAQFYLGNIYFKGLGTLTHFEEAYLWFSLAAANDVDGSAALRDLVRTKLSNRSLINAQKKALDIFKTFHETTH